MSDNVGLTTPRGSGTSGYVQRNLANLRRNRQAPYPPPGDIDDMRLKQRQPDKGLLEHERKRQIEVKVFELRDKLEDEGVDEGEIDDQCDRLRAELQAETSRGAMPAAAAPGARTLKAHQVHELAEAKIKESERLRRALKISKDYQEGGHWRRQEEKERLRRAGEEGAQEDDGQGGGQKQQGRRLGERQDNHDNDYDYDDDDRASPRGPGGRRGGRRGAEGSDSDSGYSDDDGRDRRSGDRGYRQ